MKSYLCQEDDPNSIVAKRLGQKMREDRKKTEYTLLDMSEKIDVSQAQLTRFERGERVFNNIEKLIQWCEIVQSPLEDYLQILGWIPPKNMSLVRKAFPSITNDEQEAAINAFAELIIRKNLTPADMMQIITSATALAEFADKNNNK